ncbi:MAG: 2-amino-4-hydroxy-6-hydroxymethyldihydropteridine diphosphokinase [Gammaproteobacteria bacterium]|nr:2-amino-4-hydroxy-6-hydroxymethyldihydropteridine diphosphokinase [Gammaproteobacteria bacterium]
MPEVFIGIGSNVEPQTHIREALKRLRMHFGKLQVSPVYRNPAVGFVGEDFLNLAVAFESLDSVASVRTALDAIEAACGRIRGSPRFAPRTLDLDLLMYGDVVTDTPVRLPRPEILEYAYVLKPLTDLAAGRLHPVTGRTLGEHWREFDASRQPLVAVKLGGL